MAPGVHPGVGADGHRDGPQLLLGAAVLRLVAGESHRILRPWRGHPVDRVVQQPLGLGAELGALGAERHRVEQHHVVGQPVVHRGGRVHQRHGAHAPGLGVVHHEAHIGESGAVGHRLVVGQPPGDEPVDLRFLQPGIGDGRRDGLGGQRLSGPLRVRRAVQPGEVAAPDAHDGRLPGKVPIAHRPATLVTQPPSSPYRRSRSRGGGDEDKSR